MCDCQHPVNLQIRSRPELRNQGERTANGKMEVGDRRDALHAVVADVDNSDCEGGHPAAAKNCRR